MDKRYLIVKKCGIAIMLLPIEATLKFNEKEGTKDYGFCKS